MNRYYVLCALPLLLAFAGCGGAGDDGESADKGGDVRTGMELTVDLNGGTDAAGVQFVITRVACEEGEEFEPFMADFIRPFEDMRLSGEVPEEGNPLDDDAGHIFSDFFITVSPGCYDVLTQPVNSDGEPSEDCAAATADGVVVVEGETTEILLINQCEGEDDGALDVISVLNHPPHIDDLVHNPSKFVFECEITEICVTASDVDNDPLEFEWTQIGGPAILDPPGIVVTSTDRVGNVWTQCITFAPSEVGTYEFEVTVYDLGETEDGTPIRFEDLLELQGDPNESRSSLEFPVHAGEGLELLCIDGETGETRPLPGVRDPVRADACDWASPEDIYCNPENPWFELYCPNGVFDPSAVYSECPSDDGPPVDPPTCAEQCAEIQSSLLEQCITTLGPGSEQICGDIVGELTPSCLDTCGSGLPCGERCDIFGTIAGDLCGSFPPVDGLCEGLGVIVTETCNEVCVEVGD